MGLVIGGGIVYYLQSSGANVSDFIPKIDTDTLEIQKDYSQFIGQSITANQFSFKIVDIKKHKTGPQGDSGKYFEYLEAVLKIENHGNQGMSPETGRYYVRDSEGKMYQGQYYSGVRTIQPRIPEEMSFSFRIPTNETLKLELLVPVIGKWETLAPLGRVI